MLLLMHTAPVLAGVLLMVLLAACTGHETSAPRFALAIHAGAGVIDKNTPPEKVAEYEASLRAALALGRDHLASGGTSLDAVEKVVRFLEDDPLFNAGKGAVFTEDGRHELDAAIMDGATLRCGAVAGVTTVKNPISLARLVMERTRFILFTGPGAEAFATTMGVPRVENSSFDTPHRREALEKELEKRRAAQQPKPQSAAAPPDDDHGTVGAVALDIHGNLAVATSTGGLTAKTPGRVGDTPLIGCGSYADNATCALSCTGSGEQFIRHAAAKEVSDLVHYRAMSVQKAAEEVILRRLKPNDGGLIAVSRNGDIALVFSTPGMFRGTADSKGRFEVAIWR